ncbi:N-acetylmuramate alpha-1-phosphate uridylyltransferase MurU [Candidatus Berkiella aquae]|uniref:D-glycero-alpha-D-manno-heptose 1-phosphate guanylyltransferase n=1 Tax=Candidatus Berkiella aquae TaxID=295108 RepID=A0A0Q9YK07_9GAMM|nr:nucleotidyltransferase family protein [Candidatus Berkiella aquae]MCS5710116.1 nucleotidyltransferase family protein [Candidatus Berkiella aquae]
MRAMILAAGRGNRLRPLTDHCPKPLVSVANKPLIVYHIENLALAGFKEIVINLFHLGEKIEQYLGNGAAWGVSIAYSHEPALLEVGGGICYALDLLGSQPFAIVNGDIWTDYPFAKLPHQPKGHAHLVLVDNPLHHLEGDFAIQANGALSRETRGTLTYSGIAVLHPALFANDTPGDIFRLSVVLDQAILAKQLYGEYYNGSWTDVGTIERLQSLENALALTPFMQKIS